MKLLVGMVTSLFFNSVCSFYRQQEDLACIVTISANTGTYYNRNILNESFIMKHLAPNRNPDLTCISAIISGLLKITGGRSQVIQFDGELYVVNDADLEEFAHKRLSWNCSQRMDERHAKKAKELLIALAIQMADQADRLINYEGLEQNTFLEFFKFLKRGEATLETCQKLENFIKKKDVVYQNKLKKVRERDKKHFDLAGKCFPFGCLIVHCFCPRLDCRW